MMSPQKRQRRIVRVRMIALPNDRMETRIGRESQPVEILEDGRLEFRSAADAVVILDAQADASARTTREAPHKDRVDHMTEVQVSGGRRRETCGERLQGRLDCP